MASRSLFFCTSYFANATDWASRYQRWLEHHLAISWSVTALAMIDDGSPHLPVTEVLQPFAAKDVGRIPLPKKALVQFEKNLGRQGILNYPGWWRSFLFAFDLAEAYGFDKIIHVESDAYVLSQKMVDFIESADKGWTLLWSQHFKMPETAIQIICSDAFDSFRNIRDKGPYAFPNQMAENVLPYTRIEKGLTGDRYSDARLRLPADADYAVQIVPSMSTRRPEEWAATSSFKSLAQASGTISLKSNSGAPGVASPAEILKRGITAYQRDDFAGAVENLEAVKNVLAGDVNLHKCLAAALMNLNRIDDAIAEGEVAARFAPQDAGLANMLGAFYSFRGYVDRAIAEWARALRLDPSDLTALRNIQSTEHQNGLGHAQSDQQRLLIASQLLDELATGPFSRAAFNTLLEVWNPNDLDPVLVRKVLSRAHREIDTPVEFEARGLAQASFAIGDLVDALATIDMLTRAGVATAADENMSAEIRRRLGRL